MFPCEKIDQKAEISKAILAKQRKIKKMKVDRDHSIFINIQTGFYSR